MIVAKNLEMHVNKTAKTSKWQSSCKWNWDLSIGSPTIQGFGNNKIVIFSTTIYHMEYIVHGSKNQNDSTRDQDLS